jgi:hypothetical protein
VRIYLFTRESISQKEKNTPGGTTRLWRFLFACGAIFSTCGGRFVLTCGAFYLPAAGILS